MGVVNLWEVLKDAKSEVKLGDIKGLTLAVDLAAWICESEGVKPMKVYVANPYLRNLFFRVSSVLKAGVNLVFVLDGKAPDLKLETIAKRLASSSGSPKKFSSGVRSRLNAKLKQCCVLLDTLGVPWIKAECEAEALCAELNKSGLVDGVVTNDGDAFLYGARTVYRNFSVEKNTVIEKYSMSYVEENLYLRQRDLIALGLLLGCDYCPKGVPGIGVAQAAKLLTSFKGHDALSVFSMWRKGRNFNTHDILKKPTHCSTCSHEGTKKQHCESGCRTCDLACANSTSSSQKDFKSMPCVCKWHKCEEKRKVFALEEKIKTAALEDPNFPDQDIIKEFLKPQKYVNCMKPGAIAPKDDAVSLKERFKSKVPRLDLTCKYLEEKLEWKLEYSLSKALPLLTHHLLNTSGGVDNQVSLNSIIRTRVKDHVPSLEVKWTLNKKCAISTSPDTDLLTIEPEEDFKKVFPAEVEKFYEDVARKKQEKKKEKAEERKAQRKLKVGSKASAQSSQTTKMTDFFKTKKLRIVEISSDSESKLSTQSTELEKLIDNTEKDVRDLESILNSLSIAQNDEKKLGCADKKNEPTAISGTEQYASRDIEGSKQKNTKSVVDKLSKKPTLALDESTKGNTLQKAKKIPLFNLEKQSDHTENLPGKAPKKSTLKCPVMIFSSDSESDGECETILGAKLKKITPSESSLSTHHTRTLLDNIKEPISNDAELTFGNELNFSLGSSLLHTPTPITQKDKALILSNKENTNSHILNVNSGAVVSPCPGSPLPLDEANLNCSDENINPSLENMNTPQGAHNVEALKSGVDIADSPVFMTLMERIKARKKN